MSEFPLRPIKTEADYLKAQGVVDALLDRSNLSEDEKDYLVVLGLLISDWEQKQEALPDICGVELLRELIKERGLSQKDLVFIFRTESIVSDVLNGKRQLTVRHITELSKFFHVSPAVFFPS